ncbi:MAG: translation initiation factor IF-2 associated domain-containing protein, partial [Alphaproteobacteria bacterium]|nr:translation initiation factor IF-2 associated domain-containing protein [Alphaproteobacteria bacterium]
MTEEKKPLTLSGKTLTPKKTLSLGGVRSGTGSGKTVQVEVRKKRVVTAEATPAVLTQDASQKLKLVQEAQRVAEHAKKLEAERLAKEAAERAEREREEAEEAARLAKEAEKAQKAEQVSVPEQPVQKTNDNPKKEGGKKSFDDEGFGRRKEVREEERTSKKGYNDRRNSGKINVNAYTGGEDDDDLEGGNRPHRRSLASIKRAREKERLKHLESLKTAEKVTREVVIPETITVQELANRMSEKGATVVKTL